MEELKNIETKTHRKRRRFIRLASAFLNGILDRKVIAFPQSRSRSRKIEASKTIAHEIGGIQNDALRFGLHGVKSDLVGSHPLEAAYHAARRTHEEMNRKVLTTTYGSAAFPLKMDLDRQIFSRFQRPPGAISSSMLGLEAMTGSLDKIYFEDYLNDPNDSKSVCPHDMHHGMEVRNGLSNGPICPSFI